MSETNLHRDNHYVPSVYLKQWESSAGQVWIYRILVSHEKVPLWTKHSIRGIAYHKHLYTRIALGNESDEIERWFDREFETPAEEALHKATSNARMAPSDWRVLVRFLAAQDVRTPARLVEDLQRWNETLPALWDNTLKESVQRLEAKIARGEELSREGTSLARDFPIRIKTEIEPNQKFGRIRAETTVGRGLWLFSINHLLTETLNVLHQHRWTILSPAPGLKWFTSDDPVIRVNFNDPKHYDFGGGWGKKGTEIFMPLSQNHLLYTQVGKRPPSRGTQLGRDHTEIICCLIAEHAHRIIFTVEPDQRVPELRPRTVSADMLKDENMQWSRWHRDQTMAEKDLMGGIADAQEQKA